MFSSYNKTTSTSKDTADMASSTNPVQLTNVKIITDEYLGQYNLAFENDSQMSVADSDQPSSVVTDDPNSNNTNFRRSNWTYPSLSIDRGQPPANGHLNHNNHHQKKMSANNPGRITYSWNNICISANASNSCGSWLKKFKPGNNAAIKKIKRKELLKNVNGAVSSGELVCILGSSGAGKTTLLNTLTYRNGSNLKMINGERYINGEPVNSNLLSTVSAYIQQQDLFIGTLTVREHLRFHAMLRMHANIPYATRMEKVEEVIDEFSLRKCVDTIIGIPGRIKGLSGGEQKRLAFASEILTDPVLLFCDEPTSGLDSFMAQTIVECLKKQSQKGKAILCTIHQPSSALFMLFDRVLVMAEGRVAYFGPTKTVLTFFENEGYPCPSHYNPAEFLTEALAIQPDNEVKCRQTVSDICDGFDKTAESLDLKKIIEDNSSPSTVANSTGALPIRLRGYDEKSTSHYKASWIGQFAAVLWRSWISYVKDPFVLNLRILQNIALALIVGCVYWQQNMDQDGITNINGAIFLFLAALTYQNVFGVVDVFCAELPVFLREHWNGMYRTDVYYLAKVVAELPFYILFPSIMVSIAYYMIGFYDSIDAFLYTVGILILITNVTTSFGYFLSCLASTVTMALILAPALIFPFFLFGGFFMSAGTGPVFLRWIKHISWFYYGYEAIAIVQWKDVTNITCNHYNGTCPGGIDMTGKMVLDTMAFDEDNLEYNVAALGALVGMFQVIAYVALLTKTFRRNS